MVKQPETTKKNFLLRKPRTFIGLGLLALALLWIIFTVIVPLSQGTGVDKYSGLQKRMAEVTVDLSRLYNGPQSPSWIPRFMYQVHIDDIRPVTQEEVSQFCKDPTYITSDPDNTHFYTIVVSERYLLNPAIKTAKYVGCNPTDYIYLQVFGYPEGLDPRVKLSQ